MGRFPEHDAPIPTGDPRPRPEISPRSVRLEFVFGGHRTHQDANLFQQRFAQAHVISIESARETDERVLNTLSRSQDPSEREVCIREFLAGMAPLFWANRRAILRTIAGSNKPIIGLEMPREETEKLMSESEQKMDSLHPDFSFDENLANFDKIFQLDAKSDSAKDAYVLSHVPSGLARAFTHRPELARNATPTTPVIVLIERGNAHDALLTQAQQAKYQTERYDEPMDNHYIEVIKVHRSGRKPDRLLLSKAMMTFLLMPDMYDDLFLDNQDSREATRIIRKIFDSFDEDSLRAIYARLQEGADMRTVAERLVLQHKQSEN